MAKDSKGRGSRGRFLKGADAQDQFLGIRKAQSDLRKGKRKGIIESTDKSSKRLDNELGKSRTPTMPSSNSVDADLKAELNAALSDGRSGQRAAAVRRLAGFAKERPQSGPVLGVLGKLCFEMRDFRAAAGWFRRTIRVSPKSELASLGLFHSLWKLERRSAAFGEMSRFLSISDSAEYTRLLREMAAAGDLTVRRRSLRAA